MNDFQLDPRLAKDCHVLGMLQNQILLLMNQQNCFFNNQGRDDGIDSLHSTDPELAALYK